MKINRDKLESHLQRISCGGVVNECIFTGAFGTQALTRDHLLLVLAPPLKGTEVFSKTPVGVADLNTFIKSLRVLAGTGPDAIDVEVRHEGRRVVVDEGLEEGSVHLMTAAPKTIATRVEPDTVKKLLAKAPDGKIGEVPLTKALIDGIRNTFSLLKATEVELFVGPKGGKIRAGNEDAHFAEFLSDELVTTEEYTVLFGSHLVSVLATVTNFDKAVLRLGGPAAFVLVKDGPYEYLLSPKKKSADDTQPSQ